MTADLQSLADDFLSSQEFLLGDLVIKQDAAGLLNAFAAACAPGDLTIVILERALMEHLARLDVSLAVKRRIPALLRAFFSWCAESGAWPPARMWTGWIDVLTPKFLQTFRDDGSMRGETFRKKYTDVHRNDPCPCGSGKKFKKCCLGILR
ncbi:MAG: SEC-C domain-containing protein [Chitinispirillaceae bacterium]|nr:SEC-C domain-containing protein [Chitinispirillaceae bacterium]